MTAAAAARSRRLTMSPTQMRDAECHLSWHWGYQMGYRPVRRSEALEFGIGIHEALDQYYGSGADPVEVFRSWADRRIDAMEGGRLIGDDLDKLIEQRDLGVGMLTGYLDTYAENDDFEVIATEHTLRRVIPTPGGGNARCDLVVRLDGLVRDLRTAQVFSLEHKTFDRWEEGSLERDIQFTAQVWVGQNLAKTLGLTDPVVGVLYNGLRKKVPSIPAELKNGSTSKAACDTTEAVFRRTLAERGHNPADYEEILTKLRIKERTEGNPFFVRQKLYRSEQQVRLMLTQAYETHRRVHSKNLVVYPSPSMMRCKGCGFKEPCLAYMTGGDHEFLLDPENGLYTRRSA